MEVIKTFNLMDDSSTMSAASQIINQNILQEISAVNLVSVPSSVRLCERRNSERVNDVNDGTPHGFTMLARSQFRERSSVWLEEATKQDGEVDTNTR